MSNLHDQASVLEERQVLNDPELHLREARKTRTIKSKPEFFKIEWRNAPTVLLVFLLRDMFIVQ